MICATPWVGSGVIDHPSSNRIQLDIPCNKGRAAWFDGARKKPTLPKMPLPALAIIYESSVTLVSVAHTFSQGTFRRWNQQQMDMIWHQAIGQ
jgi:hypothetical protein